MVESIGKATLVSIGEVVSPEAADNKFKENGAKPIDRRLSEAPADAMMDPQTTCIYRPAVRCWNKYAQVYRSRLWTVETWEECWAPWMLSQREDRARWARFWGKDASFLDANLNDRRVNMTSKTKSQSNWRYAR